MLRFLCYVLALSVGFVLGLMIEWRVRMSTHAAQSPLSALTGGVLGLFAGVPAVIAAVMNADWMPVFSGTVLGVIGVGWAVYKFPNDQALSMNTRLSAEVNRLAEENGRLHAQVAGLQELRGELAAMRERSRESRAGAAASMDEIKEKLDTARDRLASPGPEVRRTDEGRP